MGRRVLVLVLMLLTSGAGLLSAPTAAADGAACPVEPRSAETVVDLWFDPEGTPRAAAPAPLSASLARDFDAGTPADAATVAAIEAVAREWAACTNAGEALRAASLVTDGYLQRQGPEADSLDAIRSMLAEPPAPRGEDAMIAIGPVSHARVYADGRAGAWFSATGVRAPGQTRTTFMLFERSDGAWQIAYMTSLLAPPPTAPVWGYRVVATYPHDPEAFTQGLVLTDGTLYEGTGLRGASELRRVELETGAVLQAAPLSDEYFGEGIAVLGDRIYQLTWTRGVGFVYDRDTFTLLETFSYAGEGWGLTTDGERLIMSDGSHRIVFRDPETFTVLGAIDVTDGGLPVTYLNELEWVDGEIWANVWQTHWIVRIDPATGEVTGWLDMAGLLPADAPGADDADVFNGIAWDPATGQLLVTGKRWPTLFEIEPVPPAD